MMRNVEHLRAWQDPAHATNQGSIISLANGELLLGYNQERGLAHADSGQSCLIKSRDGGRSWDADSSVVVWPGPSTLATGIARLHRSPMARFSCTRGYAASWRRPR